MSSTPSPPASASPSHPTVSGQSQESQPTMEDPLAYRAALEISDTDYESDDESSTPTGTLSSSPAPPSPPEGEAEEEDDDDVTPPATPTNFTLQALSLDAAPRSSSDPTDYRRISSLCLDIQEACETRGTNRDIKDACIWLFNRYDVPQRLREIIWRQLLREDMRDIGSDSEGERDDWLQDVRKTAADVSTLRSLSPMLSPPLSPDLIPPTAQYGKGKQTCSDRDSPGGSSVNKEDEERGRSRIMNEDADRDRERDATTKVVERRRRSSNVYDQNRGEVVEVDEETMKEWMHFVGPSPKPSRASIRDGRNRPAESPPIFESPIPMRASDIFDKDGNKLEEVRIGRKGKVSSIVELYGGAMDFAKVAEEQAKREERLREFLTKEKAKYQESLQTLRRMVLDVPTVFYYREDASGSTLAITNRPGPARLPPNRHDLSSSGGERSGKDIIDAARLDLGWYDRKPGTNSKEDEMPDVKRDSIRPDEGTSLLSASEGPPGSWPSEPPSPGSSESSAASRWSDYVSTWSLKPWVSRW